MNTIQFTQKEIHAAIDKLNGSASYQRARALNDTTEKDRAFWTNQYHLSQTRIQS